MFLLMENLKEILPFLFSLSPPSIWSVYMYACSQVRVHVCAHACGRQKLTSLSWCTLFTETGSLAKHKTGWFDCSGQPICPNLPLWPPQCGEYRCTVLAPSFYVGVGDLISLLMLAQYALLSGPCHTRPQTLIAYSLFGSTVQIVSFHDIFSFFHFLVFLLPYYFLPFIVQLSWQTFQCDYHLCNSQISPFLHPFFLFMGGSLWPVWEETITVLRQWCFWIALPGLEQWLNG